MLLFRTPRNINDEPFSRDPPAEHSLSTACAIKIDLRYHPRCIEQRGKLPIIKAAGLINTYIFYVVGLFDVAIFIQEINETTYSLHRIDFFCTFSPMQRYQKWA